MAMSPYNFGNELSSHYLQKLSQSQKENKKHKKEQEEEKKRMEEERQKTAEERRALELKEQEFKRTQQTFLEKEQQLKQREQALEKAEKQKQAQQKTNTLTEVSLTESSRSTSSPEISSTLSNTQVPQKTVVETPTVAPPDSKPVVAPAPQYTVQQLINKNCDARKELLLLNNFKGELSELIEKHRAAISNNSKQSLEDLLERDLAKINSLKPKLVVVEQATMPIAVASIPKTSQKADGEPDRQNSGSTDALIDFSHDKKKIHSESSRSQDLLSTELPSSNGPVLPFTENRTSEMSPAENIDTINIDTMLDRLLAGDLLTSTSSEEKTISTTQQEKATPIIAKRTTEPSLLQFSNQSDQNSSLMQQTTAQEAKSQHVVASSDGFTSHEFQTATLPSYVTQPEITMAQLEVQFKAFTTIMDEHLKLSQAMKNSTNELIVKFQIIAKTLQTLEEQKTSPKVKLSSS